MRWSKLAKAMSLSLALAAATLAAPQLATPAKAGAVIVGFHKGDIVKLKTFWEGGFVLNFGGSAGTKTRGAPAMVHWNFSWDNPNRFLVFWDVHEEGGFDWYMLKNRHSGLCLSAQSVEDRVTVIQQHCDTADEKQRWAGEWWPDFSTAWIRNLAFHWAEKNTILSQIDPEVGSPIWMEHNRDDRWRQEWEVQTCIWNGVEQKDC